MHRYDINSRLCTVLRQEAGTVDASVNVQVRPKKKDPGLRTGHGILSVAIETAVERDRC